MKLNIYLPPGSESERKWLEFVKEIEDKLRVKLSSSKLFCLYLERFNLKL